MREPSKNTGRRVSSNPWKRKEYRVGWILAAPAILFFGVFKLYLVLLMIWDSFRQIGLFGESTWVGLTNYAQLLANPDFLSSVESTLMWVTIGVAMTVFPTLGLALMLEKPPLKVLWRAVYFLPGILSWAMEGPIWIFLLTPGQGPIARIFATLGLPEPNWLGDPHLIFFVLGALLLWQQGGFLALFYLAALAEVDPSLLDAARVDGANAWGRFRWVTLPLLIPTVGVVLSVALLQTFSGFSEIYVLTGAAVYRITDVLPLWVYNHGIVSNQVGIASAASLVLFVMTLAVTFVGLRRTRGTL